MSVQVTNKGLYLYGIIPKVGHIEFEQRGMEDQRIFTIEHKNILAVVSSSSYKVHDISSKNLLIHNRVLKEIMDKSDVLPFNFGNVLKSKKDLIKFLSATYIHILKMLKKVSGRTEFGLKVFIKDEKFNDEIETSEIKRLKKQIEKLDGKEAYMLEIELGRLVKKSIEEKQKNYEAKIFDFLKPYYVSVKSNECSTVKMILNLNFLINKDEKELFGEKVNEICIKYEELLKYKYSGPWPPYNFVDAPR